MTASVHHWYRYCLVGVVCIGTQICYGWILLRIKFSFCSFSCVCCLFLACVLFTRLLHMCCLSIYTNWVTHLFFLLESAGWFLILLESSSDAARPSSKPALSYMLLLYSVSYTYPHHIRMAPLPGRSSSVVARIGRVVH